jgi:hypothetical protein
MDTYAQYVQLAEALLTLAAAVLALASSIVNLKAVRAGRRLLKTANEANPVVAEKASTERQPDDSE